MQSVDIILFIIEINENAGFLLCLIVGKSRFLYVHFANEISRKRKNKFVNYF